MFCIPETDYYLLDRVHTTKEDKRGGHAIHLIHASRKHFYAQCSSSVAEDCRDDVRDSELAKVGICLRDHFTKYRELEEKSKRRTCPQPTNTIGCPVTYVMDSAAPT